MAKTLRRYKTGESLGAGDAVTYRGETLYVDSWSVNTGAVWLRRAREYVPGGRFDVEAQATEIGCFMGYPLSEEEKRKRNRAPRRNKSPGRAWSFDQ